MGRTRSGLVMGAVVIAVASACAGTPRSLPATGTRAPEESATSAPEAVPNYSPPLATSPTRTPLSTVDPLTGALALFVTLSPGTSTSSVDAGGQRIVLQSTAYNLVRIVEGQPTVHFDWTVSASYSKSYVFPITSAGRLYTVHEGDDTLDIYSHDPRTAGPYLFQCRINGWSLAIVGDRPYFRTPVVRDLAGRYIRGGDLAYYDFPCRGQPIILASLDELPRGAFSLLSAAGQLYTSGLSGGDITLNRVDLVTGKHTEFARLRSSSIYEGRIFDGDGGIYFALTHNVGEELQIVRLPPEGLDKAEIVAEIPTSGKVSLGHIDASEGEVYISFADPDGHFYLVGRTGELRPLQIDRDLFTRLVRGAQILRLDGGTATVPLATSSASATPTVARTQIPTSPPAETVKPLTYLETALIGTWTRFHRADSSDEFFLFRSDRTACYWEVSSAGSRRNERFYTHWELNEASPVAPSVFYIVIARYASSTPPRFHFALSEVRYGSEGLDNLRMRPSPTRSGC